MKFDILVNKNNHLDKSYIPTDLVETDQNENNFHHFIDASKKPLIRLFVLKEFNKMRRDAHKDNIDFIIDSGYRSYEYQEKIWNTSLKKFGLDKTKKQVALPGTSEHQTGLAIDIAYYQDGLYSDDVKSSDKEVKWLQNNSYKYGFILRYPKDKEKITGYNYEPWHYRYVGKDIASICYKNKLTLEEYYIKKHL